MTRTMTMTRMKTVSSPFPDGFRSTLGPGTEGQRAAAENHYTADYPEDEVDSEDEYDRHAYLFRNANASDEEEYDLRDEDEDEDEDMYVMEGDKRRGEDDVFQEKIRRYIRQHGSN